MLTSSIGSIKIEDLSSKCSGKVLVTPFVGVTIGFSPWDASLLFFFYFFLEISHNLVVIIRVV